MTILFSSSASGSTVMFYNSESMQDLYTADLEEAIRKVTAIVVAHRLTAAP